MNTHDNHDGCQELIDALYGYVEGNCAKSQRDLVQKKVEECPRCLELLGIEQQVRQLLRQRCGEHAPQELRSRIVSELHVKYVEIRRE